MNDYTALIDDYLHGPRVLRQAVAGMTPEQAGERPGPGKWSTIECVCHIADTEQAFADRMKRVIAEDGPTFFNMNPDAFIPALRCQQRNLEEELAVVDSTRRQIGRILRMLPPEAWNRTGTHRTDGKVTLEQLAAKAVMHLLHHVRFIEQKRRALMYQSTRPPTPDPRI